MIHINVFSVLPAVHLLPVFARRLGVEFLAEGSQGHHSIPQIEKHLLG